MKRTVIVAAATLSVCLAPGIANAVPGEPGQCSGTGYCQIDPVDSNLDGSSVVVPGPTFGDKLAYTLGHALSDFLFGPQW